MNCRACRQGTQFEDFVWPYGPHSAKIPAMKIVLTTLHAKYVHASLALPYLSAACAGLDGVTAVIREFTVNEPPDLVLRRLVAEGADLVAFSCYIWNIEPTLRLASDLKKVAPNTFIVLGGPEASFGCFELLEQNPAIGCIVRGEGEETFRELVAALAHTGGGRDALQCVSADIPGLVVRAGDELAATAERTPIADLDAIPSPFAAGLVDLVKPLVYCETSRGCPFSCAFCMSSLEKGVRSFSMGRIEADLRLLMERGVQTVKLVDRTFNFDAERAAAIWEFILRNNRASRFHFEIAADLLTGENLRLLARVPAGIFRFEIGVQSGDEETLARVGRRSDMAKLFANVRTLVATTAVTVHLDLVAGLPHEDYPGFLASLQLLFDALDSGADRRGAACCALPEAAASSRTEQNFYIQVEPLKVLKGSPMRRIAEEEGYEFSATPPYKILRTPWLTFPEIFRIETIARLLDLFHNSGRFAASLAVLARTAPLSRIFAGLAEFWADRDQETARSLVALFEAYWEFGEGVTAGEDRERLRNALCYDYCLAEYPAAGRLPRFFPENGGTANGGKTREKLANLARRLGIGRDCRLRTFTGRFARDPRRPGGEVGEVRLLFVYIATPGRGLEVRVLEEDGETAP
jgi:anaerobic magnesium-protoporphyrin IX monomethyl ester cyclase